MNRDRFSRLIACLKRNVKIFVYSERIRNTYFFRAREVKRVRDNVIKRIEEMSSSERIDRKKQIEFEKKWKTDFFVYERIILANYYMRRIGEMSLCFHYLLEENKNRNVCFVMIPITFENKYENIPNSVLYRMINGCVEFISEENAMFWKWVIKNKKNKVCFTEKYQPRYFINRSMSRPVCSVPPTFLPSEISEGKNRINEMGIKGNFICVYTRDKAFYDKQNVTEPGAVLRARNSDINQLEYAVNRFFEMGMNSV